MSAVILPGWAQHIREIFKSGAVNQFIITGNIDDDAPLTADGESRFSPLKTFFTETLFEPIDIILFYDRGKGIRLVKGQEHFFNFLKMFDTFNRSRFSSDSGVFASDKIFEHPGLLPRAPAQAIELIDRFIHHIAALSSSPRSLAVVIDYADFIAPRGEALHLSGDIGANLIKLLDWAKDPAIMSAHIINVLMAENLSDLNAFLVECPFNAKVKIPMPNAFELADYVSFLVRNEAEFASLCEVDIPTLSQKLAGLSRVNVKTLIWRAIRNHQPITLKYLTDIKKEMIEKEAFDRVEFFQPKRNLDDVAGHEEAKQWLREDAQLLRVGATQALPMGYLVTGRIGTGKTYLIECFAGECGVPFVILKNFREKWVGATEGNLEKIFNILHALGQVVVFVDEADQFAGRRGGGDGDSGLSGRIYGMLAKEMSDTGNRGKILWIFATSRPDLLEADLKRQGRLDVHIPLFPPQDKDGKRALFHAMAKKLRIDIASEELPELPFEEPISGNELEGLLVRAARRYALQTSEKKPFKEILEIVIKDFRPSAHTLTLELMDLLAVRECTDDRFRPPRFRSMSISEVNRRIAEIT